MNGWSSVKDSPKFWDDAANLLRQNCLLALAPGYYSACQALLSARSQAQASHRGRSLRMSRGSYSGDPRPRLPCHPQPQPCSMPGRGLQCSSSSSSSPRPAKCPPSALAPTAVSAPSGRRALARLGEAGAQTRGDDTVALLQLSEPDDDVEGARGLDVEADRPRRGHELGRAARRRAICCAWLRSSGTATARPSRSSSLPRASRRSLR